MACYSHSFQTSTASVGVGLDPTNALLSRGGRGRPTQSHRNRQRRVCPEGSSVGGRSAASCAAARADAPGFPFLQMRAKRRRMCADTPRRTRSRFASPNSEAVQARAGEWCRRSDRTALHHRRRIAVRDRGRIAVRCEGKARVERMKATPPARRARKRLIGCSFRHVHTSVATACDASRLTRHSRRASARCILSLARPASPRYRRTRTSSVGKSGRKRTRDAPNCPSCGLPAALQSCRATNGAFRRSNLSESRRLSSRERLGPKRAVFATLTWRPFPCLTSRSSRVDPF